MRKKIRQDEKRDTIEDKRMIKRVLEQKDCLINRFINAQDQTYRCRYGFEIRLLTSSGNPHIGISLDHLDRQTIIDLTKSGELTNELLLLYELAHLPFAEGYRMHLVDADFDTYIVDRVRIDLDKAFNVLNKDQWVERSLLAFLKANALENMYWETEPFYAKLAESKKKELA